MNEPKPELFARYDPFVKTSPLFSLSYNNGSEGILAVRPVWIIGDLFVINEWLGSELRKTNWHLNQGRMVVTQHYKYILLSGIAQSYMLEQDTVPVIQFDLLPVQLTNYPNQVEFENADCVLHYLYKECFRDPGIFKRCLHCMLLYIFSYPEIGNLYLQLPKADSSMQELLTAIGFISINLSNFFGKPLNIYRIDRTRIQDVQA